MKTSLKLACRLVALLVLAVLLSLLLELPLLWRQFYPIHYKQIIAEQAAANKLELTLVAAVIKVESNYRPTAVSRAGARGLMQLRPSTAKEVAQNLGHQVGADFADRLFEPEYNIILGVSYLSLMHQLFDNDEILALAAYNAGPNRLRSWLAEGVWDGSWENRQQIPYRETRNYLDKVSRYKARYQKLYRDN